MISVRIDGVDQSALGRRRRHAARTRALRRQSRAARRARAPPLSDGNVLRRGDVVRIETGGGGGWGHPFDREPERVLADVLGGFVSRAERGGAITAWC